MRSNERDCTLFRRLKKPEIANNKLASGVWNANQMIEMFKTVARFLSYSTFASLLLTCEKYEFPKTPYPRIETLPVTTIPGSGVILKANVTQLGETAIISHGFVWGTESALSPDDDKIDMGSISRIGEVEVVVNYGFHADETYFVAAFIATETYVTYGKVVSFTSKGSRVPAIKGFTPGVGTWGDTVGINGNYFSSLAKNNEVEFGDLAAKVLSSTDSTITCIVPDNIQNKTVPVYVTVAGNEVKSPVDFVLQSPSVEDFFPETGTFDDVITITGTNFNTIKEKNVVKFNDHPAEVIEASGTQLKVKVPSAITEKENTISVSVHLQSSNYPKQFVISPPSVSGISADRGFIGDNLEITGNNFNPTVNGNIVMLAGCKATVLSATMTSITVSIAEGIYKSRSFNVEVIVAGQSAWSAGTFTLQDPWLRKADIPMSNTFGVYVAAAFAVGGMGYVGLGSGAFENKFWRYNPEANTWSEIAPFPGNYPRSGAASFVIGDKAYVGMGAYHKDFWSYDPQLNVWKRLADFPAEAFLFVGISVNGKGYVVTGNETENFWEYEPASDTWIMRSDYPGVFLPYVYPDTGFELNGKLYIYSSDNSTGPNSFFEFDPSTGVWTPRAEVDTEFSNGETGFSANGFGYVRAELFFHKYDPATDSWEMILDDYGPPGYRSYSLTFQIDGKVYFGGGQGTNDLWEFDNTYE